MIECFSMRPPELDRFLERQKAAFSLRSEIMLDVVLRQVLQKAYEFVPSESGSILLDDPYQKTTARTENDLVFIATFGPRSEELLGRRISGRDGIAGKVYQKGISYLSRNVDDDANFFPDIDAEIGFKTHSIVCVPIYIGENVCGVLELINRSDHRVFLDRDMTLLEIFAGYTSFMLQNALDARRAHELAKRDDLTGLFNDRWFHASLGEALAQCDETGKECVLIFMDLDNFKKINDSHGHLAGSQVLREVGFILKRNVDRDGAVVARYGGDEFVAILPETSMSEGLDIARRVHDAIISASFLDRDYGVGLAALHLKGVLSVSMGVALYSPGHDTSIPVDIRKNELLRRADSAMYEAKSLGKGRIVIASALTETSELHESLSDTIRNPGMN